MGICDLFRVSQHYTASLFFELLGEQIGRFFYWGMLWGGKSVEELEFVDSRHTSAS